MINITCNDCIPKNKTAVALGIFDGVHRGHQAVINCANSFKEKGMSSAVFTFKTDTVSSKVKNGRIEMLLSDNLKFEKFEVLGVDYFFSPDFSEFKNIPAEEFVKEILVKRLNAGVAVCGRNFRFGKGALGDYNSLTTMCQKYGIEVRVLDFTVYNGNVISSTIIRQLIREGNIEKANEMLGYHFGFELEVMHGTHMGRTWNFPTINQLIPKGQVIPRFGVYCSRVKIKDKWYNGVTNVGIKPTVKIKTMPLAETFIIDYEGDLYGEIIELELYKFLRAETKFNNIDILKNQIAKDTQDTINYFDKL